MRFSGEWRRDLAGMIDEARGLLREVREAGGEVGSETGSETGSEGSGALEAIGVSAPGPVDKWRNGAAEVMHMLV